MAELPVWVLDTNVVVSGLLSAGGPPGRLTDMILARRLMLALDDRIEDEYRRVLSRPRFGFDAVRREAFLTILQFQRHLVAPPWTRPLPPDPDDVIFLEVALETSGQVVVTGNTRHFPKRCAGPVDILSPRNAWERFHSYEA